MPILNLSDRNLIRRLCGESTLEVTAPGGQAPALDWLVGPASLLSREGTGSAGLDPEFAIYFNALDAWRRQLVEEARSCALRRLASVLGKVSDRFQASIADIFVDDGENGLATLVTHNIEPLRLQEEPETSEKESIVRHVYRTLRPYFSNDVSTDPFYRDDQPAGVPPTRSQIAVPVTWKEKGGGQTAWVVNLQSRERGAFNRAQLEEIQSAALEMRPDLLVLKQLNREGDVGVPYHPAIHGNDLVQVAERLCYTLVETIDPNYAHASIWYADRDLWVYASSGYDDEYRMSRTLRHESFTGAVTETAPGSVFAIDPQSEIPDSRWESLFVRKDKARRRGVRRVVSTPIHRRVSVDGDGQDAESRRGVSALSIYLTHPEKDTEGMRTALVHTAELFGRMTEEFERLRLDYMAASQQYLLWEKPLASTSDFHVIRDYLMKLFDADGCSLFARPLFEQRVYCVATTGLLRRRREGDEGEREERVRDPEEAIYDLKFDRGLTVYLAQNPWVPQLINNLLDRHDQGATVVPQLKFREDFEPREDHNRRFLGIGVAYDRTRGGHSESDLLGVIRLLRRPHSKPFTQCDARLLKHLAEIWVAAFLDWRRVETVSENGRKRLETSPDVSRRPERLRLRRPIPCVRSTRRLIEETVRDLHGCYARYARPSCTQGEKPGEKVTVRLLVLHEDDPEPVFRTHAYYAEPFPEIPLPDAPVFAEADPTLKPFLEPVKEGSSRTVVFNDHIHAVSVAAAGAIPALPGPALRMPLRAWSNDGLVHAVIAVDFDESVRRIEWDQKDLLPLLDAACRLCAIWGIADLGERAADVFDPALPYKGWAWMKGRCSIELREYSRRFSLNGRLTVEDVKFPRWEKFQERLDARGETWEPIAAVKNGGMTEASHLGVRCSRAGTRICIPMRIGPVLSHACVYRDLARQTDGNATPAQEKLTRLLGEVCDLWFNLSFLNINTWTAEFETRDKISDLRTWAGNVRWTARTSSAPVDANYDQDQADSLTISTIPLLARRA